MSHLHTAVQTADPVVLASASHVLGVFVTFNKQVTDFKVALPNLVVLHALIVLKKNSSMPFNFSVLHWLKLLYFSLTYLRTG